MRRTVKTFSKSPYKKGLLRKVRIEKRLGPGLESIGKTHFTSEVWSAISVERCLPALRELVTTDQVEIPVSHFLATWGQSETYLTA